MYGLEEIIRMNNPEPGGYEKQVKKNIENNSKVEKDYVTKKNWETELQGKKESKVEMIDLSELPWSEKLKKLQDLYEGR